MRCYHVRVRRGGMYQATEFWADLKPWQRYAICGSAAAAGLALLFRKALLRRLVVLSAISQLGNSDPTRYASATEDGTMPLSTEWCGIFALWNLRRLGLTRWFWQWEVGFLARLPQVPRGQWPSPGDVGYKDQPWQHQALVESVNPDEGTVTTIDGNSIGGKVVRNTRPYSWWTTFYSIEPLLEGCRADRCW